MMSKKSKSFYHFFLICIPAEIRKYFRNSLQVSYRITQIFIIVEVSCLLKQVHMAQMRVAISYINYKTFILSDKSDMFDRYDIQS